MLRLPRIVRLFAAAAVVVLLTGAGLASSRQELPLRLRVMLFPNDPEGRTLLGECIIDQVSGWNIPDAPAVYAEASRHLEVARSLKESERTLLALAHAYRGLHRDDDAIASLRRVVQINPRSVDGHLLLAGYLEARSAWSVALAEYHWAKRLDPRLDLEEEIAKCVSKPP